MNSKRKMDLIIIFIGCIFMSVALGSAFYIRNYNMTKTVTVSKNAVK